MDEPIRVPNISPEYDRGGRGQGTDRKRRKKEKEEQKKRFPTAPLPEDDKSDEAEREGGIDILM
jgi:hypothetical protein